MLLVWNQELCHNVVVILGGFWDFHWKICEIKYYNHEAMVFGGNSLFFLLAIATN